MKLAKNNGKICLVHILSVYYSDRSEIIHQKYPFYTATELATSCLNQTPCTTVLEKVITIGNTQHFDLISFSGILIDARERKIMT